MDELPENSDFLMNIDDDLLQRDHNWEQQHDPLIKININKNNSFDHALDLDNENSFGDKSHYIIDQNRHKTEDLNKIL